MARRTKNASDRPGVNTPVANPNRARKGAGTAIVLAANQSSDVSKIEKASNFRTTTAADVGTRLQNRGGRVRNTATDALRRLATGQGGGSAAEVEMARRLVARGGRRGFNVQTVEGGRQQIQAQP